MSKRQSNTSPPPDADLPVIFLDENIGSPVLVTELRTLKGWSVEYQIERPREFPRGMKDPELIAECGKRGWILVSCDDRFRYKEISRNAIDNNCTKVLLFPEGQYSGLQYRSALIAAQQRILTIARQHAKTPCLMRIFIDGRVKPMNEKARSEMTSRERTAQKYGKAALGGESA